MVPLLGFFIVDGSGAEIQSRWYFLTFDRWVAVTSGRGLDEKRVDGLLLHQDGLLEGIILVGLSETRSPAISFASLD